MSTASLFTDIARTHLLVDTLVVRNNSALDFHEIGVDSIKRALRAAYDAGRQSITPTITNLGNTSFQQLLQTLNTTTTVIGVQSVKNGRTFVSLGLKGSMKDCLAVLDHHIVQRLNIRYTIEYDDQLNTVITWPTVECISL